MRYSAKNASQFTNSAIILREVKRLWPILIGFSFTTLLYANIPISEEEKKKSKYLAQIENWGKKKPDHGDSHSGSHH